MLLLVLICYLGIGALLHALILGPTFVAVSLISWGILLGWPVVLAGFIAAFCIVGFVILVIGAFIYGFTRSLWRRAFPKKPQFRTRS
jgi:hypothetical protein